MRSGCSPKGLKGQFLHIAFSGELGKRMPRKARLEFEGAVYHVMDRGDRLEAIFLDDEDRRLFLRTL